MSRRSRRGPSFWGQMFAHFLSTSWAAGISLLQQEHTPGTHPHASALCRVLPWKERFKKKSKHVKTALWSKWIVRHILKGFSGLQLTLCAIKATA